METKLRTESAIPMPVNTIEYRVTGRRHIRGCDTFCVDPENPSFDGSTAICLESFLCAICDALIQPLGPCWENIQIKFRWQTLRMFY
jgi:hypothetical protein